MQDLEKAINKMQDKDYKEIMDKLVSKVIKFTRNLGEKEAEERIQKAMIAADTTLVLDGLNLTKIPESITNLTDIIRLSLKDNQLEDLNSFYHLKSLKHIEEIYLRGNPSPLLQHLYDEGIIEKGLFTLYKGEVSKLFMKIKE